MGERRARGNKEREKETLRGEVALILRSSNRLCFIVPRRRFLSTEANRFIDRSIVDGDHVDRLLFTYFSGDHF